MMLLVSTKKILVWSYSPLQTQHDFRQNPQGKPLNPDANPPPL